MLPGQQTISIRRSVFPFMSDGSVVAEQIGTFLPTRDSSFAWCVLCERRINAHRERRPWTTGGIVHDTCKRNQARKLQRASSTAPSNAVVPITNAAAAALNANLAADSMRGQAPMSADGEHE